MHKFAGLIVDFSFKWLFLVQSNPKNDSYFGRNNGHYLPCHRRRCARRPYAGKSIRRYHRHACNRERANVKLGPGVGGKPVQQKTEALTPANISEAFTYVLAAAHDIHLQSDGKFDITLAPLINLWGFGPKTPDAAVPSDKDIETARNLVGQDRYLTLDSNG